MNRVTFYLSDAEYAELSKAHLAGDDEFLARSFNEYAKFALCARLGLWTRPNPYSGRAKKHANQVSVSEKPLKPSETSGWAR